MKKWLLSITLALMAVFVAPVAGAIDTGNAIDFSITFNTMADNRSSREDGFGFWIQYRRDAIPPLLSFGGEVGFQQFTLCRCDVGTGEDTVTNIPVLFTAHLSVTLEDVLTVFGEVGGGVSFNFISGGTTDAYNVSLDPSLALDLRGGLVLQISGNVGIGGTIDAFVSQATLHSDSSGAIHGSMNLGHYGTGLIAIITF